VDFLLPEQKTIIEVEGPSHYLAPERVRNLSTEARYRLMQKQGYKVLKVPYFINELQTDMSKPTYRLEDILGEL
jgi:very-short-patch-repair endonuclease